MPLLTAEEIGLKKLELEPKPARTDLSFYDRAQPMIERNWSVIRLGEKSKIASDSNWQELATTDLDQIDRWDSESMRANCGLVAKPTGNWCFEVDDANVIARIEAETGHKMPKTFAVRSSPGKTHFHFKQSDASRKMGNVAQTPERPYSARVNNQYVLSPFSLHPTTGKPYEILSNEEIVVAPEWLIYWLKAQKNTDKSKIMSVDVSAPIVEGGRNTSLTSRAGKLRQAGLNHDEMEAALLRMNEELCKPPLQESEVRAIANSVSRYPVGGGREFNLTIAGKQPEQSGPQATATKVDTPNPVPLWDRAMPFSDIADTPMEWVLPGLIVKGETTMMTGDFGSFKSYMTYLIADAISGGGTFVGRVARLHPVLVLDRENSQSTVSLRRYLVGDLRDKKNVRLLGRFTDPGAPAITDEALVELCRTVKPFIIIDSMQDFHPGQKENDTDDMTQFSQEVNGLIDAGAVAVLIIHHVPKSGKGKGGKYRGATAIPGGVGGALFVEKIGRLGVKIEGFKTRDGEDSAIELALAFPTEDQIKDKTGRVTYSVVRSGLDRRSELRTRIVDYVRENTIVPDKERPTANSVAKALGGDRNEVYAAIKELKVEGLLISVNDKRGWLGVPGQPVSDVGRIKVKGVRLDTGENK